MKTLEREKREAKSETERERRGGREGLGGERDGWTERQREGQTVRGREAQRDGVRGDRDMQSGGRQREKLRMLKPRITEREGDRDRDIPRDTQR